MCVDSTCTSAPLGQGYGALRWGYSTIRCVNSVKGALMLAERDCERAASVQEVGSARGEKVQRETGSMGSNSRE